MKELIEVKYLEIFRFLNGHKKYVRLFEKKWRSKRLKYVSFDNGKIYSADRHMMVIPEGKQITYEKLSKIISKNK